MAIALARAAIGAAAAALLAVSAAVAQEAPERVFTDAQIATANRLIDRALADDTAYRLIESLTTEVGPRLAGSEADARAQAWAVANLKRLGFKNVRVETFELPYWARVSESAEIVSPFSQPLVVTALGNSEPTPEGGVTGEVVRFETLAALAAAPMTGLEGKIVFVDEKMTRTQDGSGYGVAVAKRSGAANEASKRGAAAAIIRTVGTGPHRLPNTGMMRYADGVAPIPTAALSNPDADLLARALARAKGPVTVSLTIAAERRDAVQSANVIGEIPGRTDEIIVIGGHLDSWDLGTGAIDDAAGVGITMAAAKLVGALRRPKRTIRVVLWGAEEVGLIGARAYAERHAADLPRHHFASESDFGAGKVWQFQSRFGEHALPAAREIAGVLRRLGVGPGNNEASGGPDVGPLRTAGVPVATLRQDGWDYFDYHHTADDTLDKIDPQNIRQNVAAWAAMLYLVSEYEGSLRPEAEAGAE